MTVISWFAYYHIVYRPNFLSDLCEEIHKREWHGEGAEEDIGDGQVGDEDVPRGKHHFVGQEGQDDGEVANHPEDDDQAVEHNQAVVNAWLQSEHPERDLSILEEGKKNN